MSQLRLFRHGLSAEFFLLLVFVLCSCHRSDSNSQPIPPDTRTFADVSTLMRGDWNSNCQDPKELGLSESSRLSIEVTTLNKTFSISPRGDCSSPYLEGEISGKITYRGTSPQGAVAVDIEVLRATLRPTTDLGVRVLNLGKACGKSNWKLERAEDVSMMIGQNGCLREYPKSLYTIIGSDDGKRLKFGSGEELTKPSRRPVSFDLDRIYIRH